MPRVPESRTLSAGDWVRVRPAQEIQSTLDGQGELAGMPFMPEMLPMVGRTFRVLRRAEAACAMHTQLAIRRLRGCVHLEGVRCDGRQHGGCQSHCLLFWREEWLERVEGPQAAIDSDTHSLDRSLGSSRDRASEKEPSKYICQATRLWQASEAMPIWDLRQYWRAATGGGSTLGCVAIGVGRALWHKALERFQRRSPAPTPRRRTPQGSLSLQVGELVEVCSADQIDATLDSQQKNRGLWFDPQMYQHCGKRFRVAARIERIVDEATGTLIELHSPTVRLESVDCQGCWHRFCSREAPLFWREIWLQRVEPAQLRADLPHATPRVQGSADSAPRLRGVPD